MKRRLKRCNQNKLITNLIDLLVDYVVYGFQILKLKFFLILILRKGEQHCITVLIVRILKRFGMFS